jgi:hypothetical protein
MSRPSQFKLVSALLLLASTAATVPASARATRSGADGLAAEAVAENSPAPTDKHFLPSAPSEDADITWKATDLSDAGSLVAERIPRPARVPESSTLALLGTGLIAVARAARMKWHVRREVRRHPFRLAGEYAG